MVILGNGENNDLKTEFIQQTELELGGWGAAEGGGNGLHYDGIFNKSRIEAF